jgi:hypothetical protein
MMHYSIRFSYQLTLLPIAFVALVGCGGGRESNPPAAFERAAEKASEPAAEQQSPLPNFRGHEFEKPFTPIPEMTKQDKKEEESYSLKIQSDDLEANAFLGLVDGKLASVFIFYKKPTYSEMLLAYTKKIGKEPEINLIGKPEWKFSNGTIRIDSESVVIYSDLAEKDAQRKKEQRASGTANSL